VSLKRVEDLLNSHPETSILVLEDDDMCREVARNILRAADFRVICARDVYAAVHSFKSGAQIDIALVDVKMPAGMPDGISFARTAQLSRPSLKVIFMSGSLGAEHLRLIDDDEFFLRKPFVPHHLLEVVARTAWQS
jgi:CheY-like chemotaxis protein